MQIEYFAILFLIVYVGAIVVLFLFVIRILELKLVNVTSGMNDFFTFRNIICSFFIIEVLILSTNQFFDLGFFIKSYRIATNAYQSTIFSETNEYFNIAILVNHSDILRQIGSLLFTEYPISVIIVSILLFVSIVGALAITLYFSVNKFKNI
jgi:NADH:ubiquinone oxidoreductase subunit 6 (subunit J)